MKVGVQEFRSQESEVRSQESEVRSQELISSPSPHLPLALLKLSVRGWLWEALWHFLRLDRSVRIL
jgi:hypothetical protein